MAGTSKGGYKAANTIRLRHGRDFYVRIGAQGGKKSRKGGFASAKVGRGRSDRSATGQDCRSDWRRQEPTRQVKRCATHQRQGGLEQRSIKHIYIFRDLV